MKELTLEITNKCQLECPWCSSVSHPGGPDTPEDILHKKLIEHRDTVNVVRMSGGEPTLHKGLRRLLARAKDFSAHTQLLTNGQIEFTSRFIDEYIIQIVNNKACRTATQLHDKGYKVSTHVVAVQGNEINLIKAMELMREELIPLRILSLQHQGRGTACTPMYSLSWTGDRGCKKTQKITFTTQQEEITCSALKEGPCLISGLYRT